MPMSTSTKLKNRTKTSKTKPLKLNLHSYLNLYSFLFNKKRNSTHSSNPPSLWMSTEFSLIGYHKLSEVVSSIDIRRAQRAATVWDYCSIKRCNQLMHRPIGIARSTAQASVFAGSSNLLNVVRRKEARFPPEFPLPPTRYVYTHPLLCCCSKRRSTRLYLVISGCRKQIARQRQDGIGAPIASVLSNLATRRIAAAWRPCCKVLSRSERLPLSS